MNDKTKSEYGSAYSEFSERIPRIASRFARSSRGVFNYVPATPKASQVVLNGSVVLDKIPVRFSMASLCGSVGSSDDASAEERA